MGPSRWAAGRGGGHPARCGAVAQGGGGEGPPRLRGKGARGGTSGRPRRASPGGGGGLPVPGFDRTCGHRSAGVSLGSLELVGEIGGVPHLGLQVPHFWRE